MKKFLYLVFILFFIFPALSNAVPGLEFVENKGQWEGPFKYKAVTGNVDIFLEQNAITYLLTAPDNAAKVEEVKFGKQKSVALNYHAYKMVFEGALPSPVITAGLMQDHYYNYYLGNDSKKWRSGIHPNLEVDYANVYNNINLHLSSSQEGNLKYDFIVKPGADPAAIRLKFVGLEKITIKGGNLQLHTSVGTVEELKPYAYQLINGQQVKVFCRYEIEENTISFSLPDGYDKAKDLVIDPTVVFATFTGSSADNWGYTATYDAAGNFYAGGIALGNGYPTTPGAYKSTFQGGVPTPGNTFVCDISISKFNSLGSTLIYSTYLGGSSNEQPHSLIVDAGGNLIIAGRSYSSNYPVTTGCYDNSFNGGGDLVVTKLNATGTGLIASTFVGGSAEDISNFTSAEFGWGNLKHNYGDDARSEVITDQSGNIYIAACTKSSDFPTTSNAIKTALAPGDEQDGVVLKLNSSLSTLIWSTYLGGDDDDAAYVLTLDKTEANLYVAGGTMSANFPFTSGAYISSYQGSIDGFISKFLNSGSYPLLRSTYIGRSGYDQCYGVQMDAAGNVYAMGQTMGGTFPVSPGVYSNPGSSQFVIKLNDQLSSNLLSTVYGSGNSNATNISPVAFLIDSCNNIYISGWGGNLFGNDPPPGTGNTIGMPINGIAGTAAQSTTDGQDFYFIVLSQNMTNLLYGTFMGRNGGVGEHVDGGTSRFDRNGIVYQAICGGCGGSTFPTTAGAYRTSNGSTNCNLVALKIAFYFGPVRANFSVAPNTFVCLGTPFVFTNNSVNGATYEWDMGDGNTYQGFAPPPYTYPNVGTFTIRLIAKNPLSCNLADTFRLQVKVDTNFIDASFKATVIDTCAPFGASFTNTSKLSKTPSGTVFTWDFGDGTTFTGQNPPNKNYPSGGTYTVKMRMVDPTACNSPDSFSQEVTFRDDNVKAGFEVPLLVCLGDSFAPTNTSANAITYLWSFGDGGTSTQERPLHKYDSIGKYTVVLRSYNPTTCNKVDSMSMDIEVRPSPLANFSFTPFPAPEKPNDTTKFTNLSKDAVKYNWNFGDGTGTQEVHPRHFFRRTGTYRVCLAATNDIGCSDTVCRDVIALVRPIADLPNAFSPNGDGNNDILYVVGAAIEKMNLKIFNRWGQLVFESDDMAKGWDGTFNGKRQEIESYAYILNATFVDDTRMTKKGNVTLLR